MKIRKSIISLKTGTVLLCLSIGTGASAQEASPAIARMVSEANQAIASGQSTESVEKNLQETMKQQGMDAHAAPPEWDVFAHARWQRGDPPAEQDTRGHSITASDHAASFVTSVNHVSN